MFGNCNHCCFCCGHPCTMLGVSLFISCKNKIQCVCVGKKKKEVKHYRTFLEGWVILLIYLLSTNRGYAILSRNFKLLQKQIQKSKQSPKTKDQVFSLSLQNHSMDSQLLKKIVNGEVEKLG